MGFNHPDGKTIFWKMRYRLIEPQTQPSYSPNRAVHFLTPKKPIVKQVILKKSIPLIANSSHFTSWLRIFFKFQVQNSTVQVAQRDYILAIRNPYFG